MIITQFLFHHIGISSLPLLCDKFILLVNKYNFTFDAINTTICYMISCVYEINKTNNWEHCKFAVPDPRLLDNVVCGQCVNCHF